MSFLPAPLDELTLDRGRDTLASSLPFKRPLFRARDATEARAVDIGDCTHKRKYGLLNRLIAKVRGTTKGSPRLSEAFD